MYKVEYIADKKIGQGPNEQMYLVKWEGYDLSYASWQPLQHLTENCLDLVEEFENNYGHLKTTIIGKIYNAHERKQSAHQKNVSTIQKQAIIVKQHKPIVKQRKRRGRISRLEKRNKDIKIRGNLATNTQKSLKTNNTQHSEKQVIQIQTKKNNKQKKQTETKISSPYPLRKNSNASDININSSKISNKNEEKLQRKQSTQQNIKQDKQRQQSGKKQNNHRVNGKSFQKPQLSFTPIIIKDPTQYLTARKNSFALRGKMSDEEKEKKQTSRISLINLTQTDNKNDGQKQPINIIGMRKKANQYEFYVIKNSKKIWMSHQYLFENYSKQLCRFYEKNMILE